GLTTLNPYQSINLAIRSRCHLYEVKSLSDEDIKKAIYKGISYLDVPVKLTDDAVETIIRASNHEIRSALNLLESASLVVHEGKTITSNIIRKLAGNPRLSLDDHEDHYY